MINTWGVILDVAWRARSRAFKDLVLRALVYSAVLRMFPAWLDAALVLDFMTHAYLRDRRDGEMERYQYEVDEWRAAVASACLALANQVDAIAVAVGLKEPGTEDDK